MLAATDGAVAEGWPYTMPAGWRVSDLYLSDGMVAARVSGDFCGDSLDARTIRITLQGTLVGDALPTTLQGVYDGMRLEGLRTAGGRDSFVQGSPINFELALVNRSGGAITLPHVDSGTDSWYVAGTLQTWVEPLGSVPPPSCIQKSGREGDLYGSGGWIIVSAAPVVIPRGGAMPAFTQPSLEPELTGCLAPGRYRYRVEYWRYGDEPDEGSGAIDAAALDFTITAGDPAVTPPPSPSSRPTPSPLPTPPPGAPTPTALS